MGKRPAFSQPGLEKLMHQPRLFPSLDDFDVYCKVCDALETEEDTSLHRIAAAIGRSASAVSQCIKGLEECFRVTLIVRAERSHRTSLTPEGRRLFYRAKRLLEEHLALRQSPADEVTELCIGTTSTILVGLLPGPVGRFVDKYRGKVRLKFKEYDYPDIIRDLKAGNIDFGLGPRLPEGQTRDIDLQIFEPKTDIVLITHPSHRFAKEFAAKQRDGIRLAELAGELVFALPVGMQPGLVEQLPLPDRAAGGDRIEVPTYTSIVSFVRMNIGVGLVPGWYWILDHLRKQGLLFYAPMRDLGHIAAAAYFRSGGRERLPKLASELLEMIEKHLLGLQVKSGWYEELQPTAMPQSIEGYRYEYHVSCNPAGVPEWRRGEIHLKQEGTNLTGHQWDLRHEEVSGREIVTEKYQIIMGAIWGNLVYWVGEGARKRSDRYVAVCNTVTRHGSLFGTWTGTDQRDLPISAPMVLSREPLQIADLHDIARGALPQVLLNADIGWGKQD